MRLDLPLAQDALHNLDKHNHEPRILLIRRYRRQLPVHWLGENRYRFLSDRCVGDCDFHVYVVAREVGDSKQGGVSELGAGGGGESIGADLERTFGDAVKDVQEAVGGVLPDLAATVGVAVVKDGVCAELAEEGRIVGGAGCDDIQAGAFGLW